jgi:DENN (AEX-3) domain
MIFVFILNEHLLTIKILKQCLPFDCKVEESEFNFSSQQTSYHSFPVRKRKSLLISNSGESSKRSENRDEILHAHVLTIRTALTDRQKMELKQVQSTDHSSRQRFEADVTWLKLNAPRTICFISKYSLHSLFADIIRFAQLRYGDIDDRFSEFLHHCIFTPVTSLGQQIQVKITSLENDLCFIHDSTFTTTTKDKLSNSNPTLNILPATINKQQIFDAISFLFEPTIINRRIAIVSDSITLLSFCLKEFEELLISIPNWNGIVHPILHHTDLHSIIAKEQGKYVIPVQRRMSHILSMTDFHIIDLDGEEVSKERSSSRLSKWLPSTTRIRSKQESKSINSSDWFDRNMFEFNSNLFHNVGRIEVVSDTHSGDLSFESLDISERSWTIQEIVPEIPSNQVQQPTKLLSRRKSILFGTKRRVLSSSSVKDVTSSKVIESIESSMNEDRGIVPQLPKLEEYQIGPIANEEPEEEATNDTITAVDQPLSRNKEEKKWQVRIRMEKSRSNIDIINQRKRNRRIGKIFEDSRVEEISNYDDDEDADDSRELYC